MPPTNSFPTTDGGSTGTSEFAPVPTVGAVVRARARTYVVEAVERADPLFNQAHLVRMACLNDDAQGQPLEVVWELELDTEILDDRLRRNLGRGGFDPSDRFGAYLHTLRWNCVTATDPNLFQSPFRAGIHLDAYQLEPLRKALRLPRVNLFIADDVGLGKTIEAGLIASELLLRRRVREIVVACPPSMLIQWQEELENRFGLTFEILDRHYLERVRRDRGFGVNPWTTFPRLLVSHKLLIDETYTTPLRDWLGHLRPGSLLILDEAHHAAPASGSRYAIDSRLTRAIRDLAPRFEHRLFLSATPHNGHSNSFSALLELLDPQRFTRGVKVLRSNLEAVMVRRLKEDLRELVGGFPRREVRQVDLSGLREDSPELRLPDLLDRYRRLRQERLAAGTRRQQAQGMLLTCHLQQRLLSSVDAFARTLAVHRRTAERLWHAPTSTTATARRPSNTGPETLLADGLDREDDRTAGLSEAEQGELLDRAVETASTTSEVPGGDVSAERALLAEMAAVAEAARGQPDARVRYLVEWIREHLCPGVRLPGDGHPRTPGARWNERRLLIFTEYDDTQRWLTTLLRAALVDTERAAERIAVFHGPTPPDRREAIKRAFNQSPAEHPLRILVATDAAREGLNLQAHCHDLFHFDVPWNPARLEQRNGRIDRKLQPAAEVVCRYFVYTQRPEDRVLRALVRKTETIRRELGSLAQIIEGRLSETLRTAGGIRRETVDAQANAIAGADLDADQRATAEEELESSRERQDALRAQIETLRTRLETAQRAIGLDYGALQAALSTSLEMLGAGPLRPLTDPRHPAGGRPFQFTLPELESRPGADPTWSPTLDALRAPPQDGGKRDFEWRRGSPVRPVTFVAPEGMDENVVQLHLEHRLVRRLLGRFLAQGFVHHDLSRACLAQTTDAIPRVILLGRLSLYGSGAARLHEEILPVAARWTDPANRKGPLAPYAREAEARSLDLLDTSLASANGAAIIPAPVAERLQHSIGQDLEELLPHLETLGTAAREVATRALDTRGRAEADALREVLTSQKRRVLAERERHDGDQLDLKLQLDDERRQLAANRLSWDRWLIAADRDLETEPARILDFYRVTTTRLEPVGLVYLWPVSG